MHPSNVQTYCGGSSGKQTYILIWILHKLCFVTKKNFKCYDFIFMTGKSAIWKTKYSKRRYKFCLIQIWTFTSKRLANYVWLSKNVFTLLESLEAWNANSKKANNVLRWYFCIQGNFDWHDLVQSRFKREILLYSGLCPQHHLSIWYFRSITPDGFATAMFLRFVTHYHIMTQQLSLVELFWSRYFR